MDELFDIKDSNNPFLQFNDPPIKPVRKRAKTQRRALSLPTNKSSAGYNLGDLLVPQTSKTKKGGKRKYSAAQRVKEHFSLDISYPTGGFDLEDDMSMLKIPNSPKTGRKKKPAKKSGKGGSHRRSSSDPENGRKRSGSAAGKLRGNYNCGKCGVPKKGHVCPHDQPKELTDAQSQCNFDGAVLTGESISHSRTACATVKYKYSTPKTKRAEDMMKILVSMQSMGIMQINDPSKVMKILLNGEEMDETVPIATAVPAEFVPPSTIVAATLKEVPAFKPKKMLRTFDTDESNVAADPYDIDMDLSDAFEVTPDLHDLLSDPVDSHDLKAWQPVDFQDNMGISAVSSA